MSPAAATSTTRRPIRSVRNPPANDAAAYEAADTKNQTPIAASSTL
jgi:hypothetical protein